MYIFDVGDKNEYHLNLTSSLHRITELSRKKYGNRGTFCCMTFSVEEKIDLSLLFFLFHTPYL